MKLYEALQTYEELCIDTEDKTFECIVTIDWEKGAEPKNNYEKFQILLYKKVEFEKFFEGRYANAIVDWSGLVDNNKELFREYVKTDWVDEKKYVLDDDDDLLFEWVEQFHYLLAGYGSEPTYASLIKLLEKCN